MQRKAGHGNILCSWAASLNTIGIQVTLSLKNARVPFQYIAYDISLFCKNAHDGLEKIA